LVVLFRGVQKTAVIDLRPKETGV